MSSNCLTLSALINKKETIKFVKNTISEKYDTIVVYDHLLKMKESEIVQELHNFIFLNDQSIF